MAQWRHGNLDMRAYSATKSHSPEDRILLVIEISLSSVKLSVRRVIPMRGYIGRVVVIPRSQTPRRIIQYATDTLIHTMRQGISLNL